MLKIVLANLLIKNTKFAQQEKIQGGFGVYSDGHVYHC
jgi:hypothetical protein